MITNTTLSLEAKIVEEGGERGREGRGEEGEGEGGERRKRREGERVKIQIQLLPP